MAKISSLDQFRFVAAALNHSSKDDMWPNFTRRFILVLEGKHKLPLEVAPNGHCEYTTLETIEDSVMAYLEYQVPLYGMKAKQVKDCVRFWAMATDPSKTKPAPFKWQDEGSLAFAIIPFDRVVDKESVFEIPETDFPTWLSVLDRMDNKDAFVEFIGCILNGKRLQSYLWISGSGADGKGSMSRCLARAFGDAYTATNAPDANERRFWAAQLLGKTIVAFNDCNESSFIRSSIFKQLSGGDAVRIDEKNQKAFMAQMHPYFIFFSNFDPRISSSRADLRRLNHCPLSPISKEHWKNDFESNLWQEMGSFLRFCDQHYNNNILRLSTESFISSEESEDLADENEDKFDGYMHSAFEFADDGKIEQGRFYSICKFQLRLNDYEISEFKRWLKTRHDLKTVRAGGAGRVRSWVGLRAIPVHSKQSDG